MSIVILCNAIKTGKSTSLFNWCKRQDKIIDGYIMLEENNQKVTYQAKNLTQFTYPKSSNILCVGNYVFDESLFKCAHNQICETLKENVFDILCLDEIGKLELNDKGWHNTLIEILLHQKQNLHKKYIIIVRDYLLSDVLLKYQINSYKLINYL